MSVAKKKKRRPESARVASVYAVILASLIRGRGTKNRLAPFVLGFIMELYGATSVDLAFHSVS